MSGSKALTLLFVTATVCTTFGGLVGFGLGRFFPNYYRNIFSNGNAPDFDPLAVGVGQGLTQGLTGGLVVGILLVLILSWASSKQTGWEPSNKEQSGDSL